VCVLVVVVVARRLTETENLYNSTQTEAREALDKAAETYREGLSIYTDAESIQVTQVDVEILNADSNQLKSEVVAHSLSLFPPLNRLIVD